MYDNYPVHHINVLWTMMCSHCMQTFQCNGTVVQHDEYGEIIQLQGDNREDVKNLLTNVGIADAERIKVMLAVAIVIPLIVLFNYL